MNAKKPPMRADIETGSGWAAVPQKRRPDRGRILGKKNAAWKLGGKYM